MGRWYYHKKATVEASCNVSVFDLKKMGLLKGRCSTVLGWRNSRSGKESAVALTVDVRDDPHVRFVYTFTERNGEKTDYDYEVSLVTTPCNLGGVRYWFACPMCGRRVGCLYLVSAGYFWCRHCNDLTYQSRSRSGIALFGHTSRQVDKLRSEIKRWTWRGYPTRKVRRLRALERKAQVLGGQAMVRIDRLKARLR